MIKLYFLLLLLFPAFISAKDTKGASEFVSALYANYSDSNYSPVDKNPESIFSAELVKLIREDEKQAKGEVGVLDFDPLCNCQDSTGLKIEKIKIDSKSNSTIAHVTFTISEIKNSLKLQLIKVKGKWLIKDISSEDIPSLYNYMKTALKK